MKAIVMTEPGGPEVLVLKEVQSPKVGPGELLVRVAATAVNRADILQRKGVYPAPKGVRSDIPGLEYAGEVVGTGPDCSRFTEGDRVMGLLPGEAYASEIVTPESLALPIPKNLDWLEAAAIPEAFITAFDALFLQVGLTKGETVLIHAVGSGVGTAAVQLSHARGAEVFGTSSSDWKLDRTKELGLNHAINRRSQDFHKTILEQTKGEGVNVIADLVGGSRWNSNLESLSNQGRLILIGLLAGARTEIDLSPILRKRLRIIGTILRSRSMQEKIRITNPFREQVLPLLESGVIKPIVDSVFPLADAAEAHRRMESNQNWGKIVLTV